MKIGYARVSTDEQELGLQITSLKNAGCTKIFQEKVEAHHLDMKLIATHYLLEEQKVIFFFTFF